MYVWDPTEDEVVGRMTLPNIDKPVANQVIEYLRGKVLEIRASDRMARTIDARNLSRAVQMSSMAHLLCIKELQKVAIHPLWHFLVLYKQSVDEEKLQEEYQHLFPGCPAQLILDECLRRLDPNYLDDLSEKTANELPPATGFALAQKAVQAAMCSETEFKETPPPVMWREICKNRQVGALWKYLGPLVETKKSFQEEKIGITNADPFWRHGGARGAILTCPLPLPKVPSEDLFGHETPWLLRSRKLLPLLSPTLPPTLLSLIGDVPPTETTPPTLLSLNHDVPAIEITPPTPPQVSKPTSHGDQSAGEETKVVKDTISSQGLMSVPAQQKSRSLRGTKRQTAPEHRENADTDCVIDPTLAFCLSHALSKVRKAKSIPSFEGFQVMVEVLGNRKQAAVVLFQHSDKYEMAINEWLPEVHVRNPLKRKGLLWVAEHILDLSLNVGSPSREVPLEGMMHGLEALEVATALQMVRVQEYLIDRLKKYASPSG